MTIQRLKSATSKRMRILDQPRASVFKSAVPIPKITKPLKHNEILEVARQALARYKANLIESMRSSLDIPDSDDDFNWQDEDDFDIMDFDNPMPDLAAPVAGDIASAGEDKSDIQLLIDVMEGRLTLDASHAGGEFAELVAHTRSVKSKSKKPQFDGRTRRDRIIRASQGLESQIEALTNAYMKWEATVGKDGYENTCPVSPEVEENVPSYNIAVLDLFSSFNYNAVICTEDATIASCLLRHGLIPNSPFKPSYAVTVRTLEVYQSIHLRCPHLALEPFVKGLFDVQGLVYSSSFRRHFSACVDVFLRLKDEVQIRVLKALGRDERNWRRKNACAPCTYKVADEPKLVFDMLVTMDGNDSLKRIVRRKDDGAGEAGEVGESSERPDAREVQGDYYLTQQEVDKWARDVVHNALEKASGDAEGTEGDGGDGATPCEGRWQNMSSEATAKMWGIFDETGVFLCLCRHGFALVLLDMVKSGELSKYPLAVVEALLDSFGANIGGGYDIGCKFKTTLSRSELGAKAKELNYTPLVGSFHGHAHNRLCQLSNLATYVKGLGLEDLEGCERFFSKSNALASALRYASTFHRRQKIEGFVKHNDEFDVSHNLSKFIVDNYKQALEILSTEEVLKKKMEANGISGPEVFDAWKKEEHEYLTNLSKEPVEETLNMAYYQKLVNFYDSQRALEELRTTFRNTWVIENPQQASTSSTNGAGKARAKKPHTQLKHAEENERRCLQAVQELEVQLEITERWTPGMPEWNKAQELVSHRRYRRCLDELEALVVSRMFELTKMNMSQTGYKLRKHIANALKARSTAIKNSLSKYNTAAQAMRPPRPTLSWDTVVEYAFLAEFDLLRESRQDVREKAWAQPLMRMLMDRHFKVARAREEIERLNVEIKRTITHIVDEENYLHRLETHIKNFDDVLGFHVGKYRQQRTRFYALHLRRFSKLASLPGFTGDLNAGTSLDRALHAEPSSIFKPPMSVDSSPPAPVESPPQTALNNEISKGDSSVNGGDGEDNEADDDDDDDDDDADDDDDDQGDDEAELDSRYLMISAMGD
ncbi:hypothetical protein CVT24_004721 [Panaeolus cyanescens]|uniref:CxC1-like cysteine cluster associated with KDZ transposases domain-containing protein n=1 Tax=Panaeolus cyanescens TaxID=181874 RepID=A0A409YSQ9_9AGAR|nr:hypothetical protein CVT24_004721 [Panaeolus cyanescens]